MNISGTKGCNWLCLNKYEEIWRKWPILSTLSCNTIIFKIKTASVFRAMFIMIKTWKQSQCRSTEWWMDKSHRDYAELKSKWQNEIISMNYKNTQNDAVYDLGIYTCVVSLNVYGPWLSD